MSDKLTTQIAYTYFRSGWTDETTKFQVFESEESVLNTLYNLVQPFLTDVRSKMEIKSYDCSASFQPQPIELGTSPAFTLPYESTLCTKWDEMMEFQNKYADWPYVDIYANVELFIKHPGYTRGMSLPAHIFYRRLKDSS